MDVATIIILLNNSVQLLKGLSSKWTIHGSDPTSDPKFVIALDGIEKALAQAEGLKEKTDILSSYISLQSSSDDIYSNCDKLKEMIDYYSRIESVTRG